MTVRRIGAALTVLLMLTSVVPAIAVTITHHALLGLFSPDLGAAVTFALIGAFLLVRCGVIDIAVILCVQGVGASLTVLTGVVRTLAAESGPLHGAGLWAAWVNNLVWLPGVTLLVPLVLLFPDGRLTSPGWRWPIRITATLGAVFAVLVVIRSGSAVENEPESFAPNPTGFVRLGATATDVLNAFAAVIVPVFASMLLVSLGALIVRRRAAHGVKRAQLTSLLYGGAMTVLTITVITFLPEDTWWTFALGLFAVMPLALSIGMAVLRYRLYEIDRIVSRTVTYALVLAVLIAVYVAVVTSLVSVVPARFGQVGVAAATLTVSVLAVPLTRRVRRLVDSRFNRRRFDADRLISRYADQLRRHSGGSTVDALGAGLVAVATRAVEPSHASVWLVNRR